MNVEQESSIDSPDAPDDGTEAGELDAPLAAQRSTRRRSARWRSILATALVLATVGAAAGVFFFQYRPDQRLDDAAAHQAIQAASDGAVALLTYSFDSLDRDFAAAKSHLTGNFLAYYSKFSEQIAAGALQGQLTASATVIKAAVSDLRPNSAAVLVFVNQTTTSKLKPEPVEAHSSNLVTLTKVNGRWLIANFDPIG